MRAEWQMRAMWDSFDTSCDRGRHQIIWLMDGLECDDPS